MSPSCRCLTIAIASSRSPSSTVEFCQSGSLSVEETTYFGMLLNLSANSPSRDGHASAKPSYVLRPSRSASDSIVSSSLNLSPSSPRLISKLQPPYLKSSAPPGSSMTPSSDTNSVTTILPILCSFRRECALPSTTYRFINQMVSNELNTTFAALADPT